MAAQERAERSAADDRAAAQRRTTLVSILAASALVALKLGVGLAAGSLALVSAGVESSGDVLAAMLTFFAVRLGRQPADREHPYGHARAENLGALSEAGMLFAAGIAVAVAAILRLISSHGVPDTRWLVFATIAVALTVDLSRTLVSARTAKRFRSPALRSNAFHFATDMAGSLLVLAGLVAVRAGFARADSLAALAIAAIVLIASMRLIAENANVLMDRTPADARAAAIRALAALEPDIELTRLRLRESAGRVFADANVSVAAGQAVVEGHRAASLVEHAIQEALPGSDVVVHVEPRRENLDLRDRVLAIALSEPSVREVHDVALYEQGQSVVVTLHLKFPPEFELAQAHAVAGRIENAIQARPRVESVQTHLEPLERPTAARPPQERRELEAALRVKELARALAGASLTAVRLLQTERGQVVLLTLALDPTTPLPEAHRTASELEETLRQRLGEGEVADVVVHTAAAPEQPWAAP